MGFLGGERGDGERFVRAIGADAVEYVGEMPRRLSPRQRQRPRQRRAPLGECRRHRAVTGTPIAEWVPSVLSNGRLAIIGDAAHVQTPMTGKDSGRPWPSGSAGRSTRRRARSQGATHIRTDPPSSRPAPSAVRPDIQPSLCRELLTPAGIDSSCPLIQGWRLTDQGTARPPSPPHRRAYSRMSSSKSASVRGSMLGRSPLSTPR